MSMDRRQFLKLAGISSILGIGATAVAKPENPLFTGLTKGVDTNKEALTAKHWAMVVDMSKFKTEEDIKKVVTACHTTHNVPDFGNIKDEVKWIWKESYEHTFPAQENPYMEREDQGDAVPGPLQPLRKAGLRPGLPDPGDVQAQTGRHRHDGHASLHRLPVLHGGLPLRRAELQLPRSRGRLPI